MILYADQAGERLDAFLARSVENLSRSGAQHLIQDPVTKIVYGVQLEKDGQIVNKAVGARSKKQILDLL